MIILNNKTPEEIVTFLMQPDNHGKRWDLKEHKERRSLDSNAYFHVLADKLRQKLGLSMAEVKNHLIASYGQIQYVDAQPMIYKTNAPEEYMMQQEFLHTKCIQITEDDNGRPVFYYRVYRGSHTYNSSEMSALIAGTVEECKAQDIETATPEEIARMAALWEGRYEKHRTV